jgi:hypothetical protein
LVVSLFAPSCSKDKEVAQLQVVASESGIPAGLATDNITIVVKAGQVYNGKGNTIKASGLEDGG